MSRLAFDDERVLATPIEALAPSINVNADIGNEGEKVVFEYEKREVKKYYPRYVDKVKNVSLIRGLGYDVQSIRKQGSEPGQAIYIEVKSTKRFTAPSSKKMVLDDSVVFTRNEWMKAKQIRKDYFIYRIYFGGIFLYKFQNPVDSSKEDNDVFAEPIRHRIDFKVNMKNCIKVD